MLPKSKYKEEKDGTYSFWNDISSELYNGEYKSMFFNVCDYEKNSRIEASKIAIEEESEPASSAVSPESQFVAAENLNSME